MRRLWATAATAAMILLVPSCREEPIEIPPRMVTPIDGRTTGTISGTVEFFGEVPESHILAIGGFPGCVIGHPELPVDDSVIVEDGKLQNVFVYIRDGLNGKVFPVPTEPAVFDQKNCLYTPHVLGVQRYQPVAVLNSDSLLHNVHSMPQNQQGFNFGQPVAGMQNIVQFKEEEVMIPVKCDVHGWMRAYIGVLDHPYFSVTSLAGTFSLENVPPGQYTLEAWHEVFGVQVAEVTVADNEDAIMNFRFSP